MFLLYHAYVYLEFLILACTIYILAPFVVIPLYRYNKGIELMSEGRYTEAIDILEYCSDYKDTYEQIKLSYYLEGDNYIKVQEYDKAADSFWNYKSAVYEDDDKYELAVIKWEICSLKAAVVGDVVEYGKYYTYSDDSEKSYMGWRVLKKEDNRVLVISEDCIYCKAALGGQTWASSSMRRRLNGSFIDEAFVQNEADRILQTNISNPDNSDYGTDGGEDTSDKIFLLSIDEAHQYFDADMSRQAHSTDYASMQGYNGTWWLRTPGSEKSYFAIVDSKGIIVSAGFAFNVGTGVRPAMWIDTNLD